MPAAGGLIIYLNTRLPQFRNSMGPAVQGPRTQSDRRLAKYISSYQFSPPCSSVQLFTPVPCLAEGIYWATGLSLTTPFTEGRLGVNNKASPPGRHQEQAPRQRCTFRPTTFSSVQFSPRLARTALEQ